VRRSRVARDAAGPQKQPIFSPNPPALASRLQRGDRDVAARKKILVGAFPFCSWISRARRGGAVVILDNPRGVFRMPRSRVRQSRTIDIAVVPLPARWSAVGRTTARYTLLE